MKGKKMQAKSGYSNDTAYANADCRGILIMDDCLADNKGWKTDHSLKWIFFNGRHADITFVLTMQYQIGLTPDYRSNIDWVFLCKENKKIERDKLWKYYAGIFPSLSMFEQIFMTCTTNKKCMVLDSLSDSETLTDQVFWFKASLRGEFHVCYDEFWQNNEYYLKKRMSIEDPDAPGIGRSVANTQKPKQEDYYKYVGGRGKMKFNLDMCDEEDQYQDDYEYMQQSGGMEQQQQQYQQQQYQQSNYDNDNGNYW
jgi:hypothetical protein